jgi:hypothetical protein
MMTKNDWFRVDKDGLAQVYARRGPAAPFFELISNAWDEEGVTEVRLRVTAVPNSPTVVVSCEDDSTRGFDDLEEARVLFAPSKKKTEAEQRGRFNVGEKLFLSLCTTASICSTGGTMLFMPGGSVRRKSESRERGTLVAATMRMTRAEALEAFVELGWVISPKGIDTIIQFIGFYDSGDDHEDGPDVQQHERFGIDGGGLFSFRAKLQSELSDEDGALRPTERTTVVNCWKLTENERLDFRHGILFEMGIPVVEIGGPFDVNVMQKVPLTVDRDNVKPAFLRRLRAETLNAGWRYITSEEEADEAWITEAVGSKNPKPLPEALDHVLDWRFTEKRVAYDPSDREGSEIAMSQGYTVVSGGSLPAAVWDNVRETRTIRPAGQVTPSNRARFSETGKDITLSADKWPRGGLAVVVAFANIAEELLGFRPDVRIVMDNTQGYGACYGDRVLLLNLFRLGKRWFHEADDEKMLTPRHVRLLLHELGHEFTESHLDEGFHKSQTDLGTKLAFLVAGKPDMFKLAGMELPR